MGVWSVNSKPDFLHQESQNPEPGASVFTGAELQPGSGDRSVHRAWAEVAWRKGAFF